MERWKNLLVAVLIAAALGVAGYMASRESIEGTATVAYFILGPMIVAAAGGAFLLHRAELFRPLITFKPGDFTRGFVVAAVLFGLTSAATHWLFPLSEPRASWLLRLYLQLGDPKELRDHVPFVVVAILLASVAEEIIWRGVMPFLLEEYVGTRRAWLYSAVVYAVAQVPTAFALRTKEAGLNPLLPAAALVCGLCWGALTRKFERLWPAIISHALFDWCVVMMFRLYGPSV
jgi:membrane protease YdiL (CAAX protease family)